MIEIIKKLKIEVSKPNIIQAVVAKQYDMNTRFIKATLVDGATIVNVPNDPTVKVVINAERPDGQSKGFDGVVNEDGTVTVPLHSWMLELDGTVICDISVIDTAADDEKKLTTTSFTLLVEKAAYGGSDVTNDPQYDVLVQLLETCNEASEVAQEALEKSNEANEKYYACVEATDNANQAAENANAVREEVEAGGFIESLKEMNKGGKFSFWVGTSEEYAALTEKITDCFYIITNDPSSAQVDYIVEQGIVTTYDGADIQQWHYEKWASGKAKCVVSFGKYYNITSKFYSSPHYHLTVNYSFPEDFFIDTPDFVDVVPIATGPATNVDNDEVVGSLHFAHTSKSKTGVSGFMEAVGMTYKGNLTVQIKAEGRWK